ncbi:MAG: metal ABC transporter permease [Kocuria rhizophila]|uniref:methionine ABC transporter permease n=1 Tax=Micrococcus endophyticus TaxID=455343 RepID=UPI000DB496F5|nr:methionine ABC transporter permease [Micrococcus endophyticus]MCK6091860.1 ABC transporter permease [Micrococcus endophyticus]MCV7538487.1 ABC transporter permease [Micrococcus luteus]PZP21273.1 MAG: metal ABC transporter permease [Kocuria rhizophila]
MTWLEDLMANPAVTTALPEAIVETLTMLAIAGVATVLIGGLMGVVLHVTRPGGLSPLPWLYTVLSTIIVNITRSVPYAILMVALIPFTKWIVGTSIGPIAATVSLTIGTAPFFARLVEAALREVPSGTMDAAQVMGSTRGQIVRKVLIPEAMPGLVAAVTTTLVTLVGYSAMAGLIGGGGLGRLAYNYGYQRFDTGVMVLTIVVMVILVQLIQWIGDLLIRRVDHR